jgi:hypothetical protein
MSALQYPLAGGSAIRYAQEFEEEHKRLRDEREEFKELALQDAQKRRQEAEQKKYDLLVECAEFLKRNAIGSMRQFAFATKRQRIDHNWEVRADKHLVERIYMIVQDSDDEQNFFNRLINLVILEEDDELCEVFNGESGFGARLVTGRSCSHQHTDECCMHVEEHSEYAGDECACACPHYCDYDCRYMAVQINNPQISSKYCTDSDDE